MDLFYDHIVMDVKEVVRDAVQKPGPYCPQCGVGPEGPDLAGNQGHRFDCPLHPENLHK